jgi:hypothetical protein
MRLRKTVVHKRIMLKYVAKIKSRVMAYITCNWLRIVPSSEISRHVKVRFFFHQLSCYKFFKKMPPAWR